MKFGVTDLSTKDKKVVNGPLLLSPQCFEDSRGFFLEEWNEAEWIKLLEENGQKYFIRNLNFFVVQLNFFID